MLAFLGKLSLGLVMGLGAMGSALGIRAAGMAATAAWAKEGKEGKPLNGRYSMFVGMPVSQTLYCIIVYNSMVPFASVPENGGVLFGIAVGVGLAQLFSAYSQGMIGAGGIRGLSENGGQGTGNIVMAMGIAESVGLFALVLAMMALNSDVMIKAATIASEVVK